MANKRTIIEVARRGQPGDYTGAADVAAINIWLNRIEQGHTVVTNVVDLQPAITSGKPVWLAAGDYVVTAPLVAGDGLILHGPGRILYPNDSYALDIRGTWGTAHTITDITTVEYPASNGRPSSRIATANAASYAKGDVILVYSSDAIPALAGTEWSGARGELVEVAGVDASYVYTEPMLADTYTTSPKLRKHPLMKVDIDGPTFRGNGDITATYGTRAQCALNIVGAAHSRIRCRFENTFSAGLIETSGWMNTIDVDGVDLANNSSDGAHGYAYSAQCATRHSRVKASAVRARCATSTNTNGSINGDGYYGGPRDVVFHDGISVDCLLGFGSHPGGHDLVYINCHDFDSDTGFGARSANVTFIGCTKTGPGRFLTDGTALYDHGVKSTTRIKGGFIKASVAEHDAWNTQNPWVWDQAFYREGGASNNGDCELLVTDFTVENKSIQSDLNVQPLTMIGCELRNVLELNIPAGGSARLVECSRIWELADAQQAIGIGTGANLDLINYTVEGAHGFSALCASSSGGAATVRYSNIATLTSGLSLNRTATGTWTLVALAPTKGVVAHGANAGRARPLGFSSVEWIGSVEPTNMADGDTWVVTT